MESSGVCLKLAASLQSQKIAYAFHSVMGYKRGIHLYDVNSRECLFTLDCHREVLDCAFSP